MPYRCEHAPIIPRLVITFAQFNRKEITWRTTESHSSADKHIPSHTLSAGAEFSLLRSHVFRENEFIEVIVQNQRFDVPQLSQFLHLLFVALLQEFQLHDFLVGSIAFLLCSRLLLFFTFVSLLFVPFNPLFMSFLHSSILPFSQLYTDFSLSSAPPRSFFLPPLLLLLLLLLPLLLCL